MAMEKEGSVSVADRLRQAKDILENEIKLQAELNDAREASDAAYYEGLVSRAKEAYNRILNDSIEAERKAKEQKTIIEAEFAAYREKLDKEHKDAIDKAKADNNDEEVAKLKAKYAADLALFEETEKKKKEAADAQAKKETAAEKKKKNKEAKEKRSQENKQKLLGKGESLTDRAGALKGMFSGTVTDENGKEIKGGGFKKGMSELTKMLGNLTRQIDDDIDKIANEKSAIDTRLQGSKNATLNEGQGASYWDKMSKDITGIAGVSPLVKQESIVEKLKSLVSKGISYNVEQRAFLETVKDKIATTFDATNSSLLRLVRLQQQDSTAARLGMESALNSFLNNMYETTEYMGSIMDGIKSTLEEAESLMGTQSAAAFEYQVQKWIGSMYSVGMSSNGVNSIAGALGKLAAGQVDSLTGSGTGNLLVMAANNAGISLADALADGLDESSTNRLMASMVEYLSNIYDETKGSKVVQQQYASVFGLTASDLKAVANLTKSDIANISGNNLSYNGMLSRLNQMADTMYQRTSIGEMMSNMWGNFKYTLASGIATNPALYATYKAANLLSDLTGGIDFGTPMVMGNGIATKFNVADLMRTAALSGSIVSGIGSMLGGLENGSGGGFSGSGMLAAIGAMGATNTVQRGTGASTTSSGTGMSMSGYIANSESSDIIDKTMGDQNEANNAQTAAAVEESNATTLDTVNETIVSIYTLLNDVVSGAKSLSVSTGEEQAWTRTYSHSTTFTY